jgi:hypothetical protein
MIARIVDESKNNKAEFSFLSIAAGFSPAFIFMNLNFSDKKFKMQIRINPYFSVPSAFHLLYSDYFYTSAAKIRAGISGIMPAETAYSNILLTAFSPCSPRLTENSLT